MTASAFPQLVLSTMTSPQAGLEDRISAAATAGYQGIGLRPKHRLEALARGRTDDDLRILLAEQGVALVELEVLSGWGGSEEEIISSWAHERALYDLADALGGHHMTVTGAGLQGSLDRQAELLADVCDRAAEHGLLVALEFLPWTEVPDADHARALVDMIGRSNAGLLVDSWHHFRGARSDEQLAAIPPHQVVAVQFDDGTFSGIGSLYEQTFHRCLPGKGEFDLVGFLRLLAAKGVSAPLCVEVIAPDLGALPVASAAQMTARATREVLARAFP